MKEDINIGVIPGRRQIFSGKTFLFLSAKQVGVLCLCSKQSSTHSLTSQLSEDPDELIKRVQSGVLLLSGIVCPPLIYSAGQF